MSKKFNLKKAQQLAAGAFYESVKPIDKEEEIFGDTLALFVWREVGEAGSWEEAIGMLDRAAQDIYAATAALDKHALPNP